MESNVRSGFAATCICVSKFRPRVSGSRLIEVRKRDIFGACARAIDKWAHRLIGRWIDILFLRATGFACVLDR